MEIKGRTGPETQNRSRTSKYGNPSKSRVQISCCINSDSYNRLYRKDKKKGKHGDKGKNPKSPA